MYIYIIIPPNPAFLLKACAWTLFYSSRAKPWQEAAWANHVIGGFWMASQEVIPKIPQIIIYWGYLGRIVWDMELIELIQPRNGKIGFSQHAGIYHQELCLFLLGTWGFKPGYDLRFQMFPVIYMTHIFWLLVETRMPKIYGQHQLFSQGGGLGPITHQSRPAQNNPPVTPITGHRYPQPPIPRYSVCVCMYVCMYACMHACMHACMQACR